MRALILCLFLQGCSFIPDFCQRIVYWREASDLYVQLNCRVDGLPVGGGSERPESAQPRPAVPPSSL